MSVVHTDEALMLMATISHELGLDPDRLSAEGLERTFEPLRRSMLPEGAVKFPPSPMAVGFLAPCSRFAERPGTRTDPESGR